jgi:prepilin-type N-terminal cleavage/methylation domain-containing protein
MNRRGFSMVELLAVLVVLGILANLALPMVQRARRKADAVAVLAAFHAVRVAAQDRYADTGTYPANAAWGRVPAALVPSLPAGFRFTNSNGAVEYRWRRWGLPNGLPANRRQTVLLGLDVRTSDRALLQTIRGLYRGPIANVTAQKITLVIE